MGDYLKPLGEYLNTLQKSLDTGKATELSHYPVLKLLIESLGEGLTVLNNPKWIDCGAPDFLISKGSATVGYIEAKDIGKSLDEAEKTDQLRRYKDSLTNLILTDYLEFRWYVDGERRLSARLGTLAQDGKIKRDKEGIQKVAELLESFLAHEAKGVGTPKELAGRMARLAHMIRELIIKAFEKETESGSLHAQYSAFRESLIPDLSTEQFADMYAQTIAYGLFAAKCTNPEGKDFTRQNAAYLLPKTNPFLRKLFNHIAGPDLDDRIAWLVDDLAQLLNQADMASILEDFGKRTAKEDPVVHFYETFLREYDPKVRETRGVYYTPEPVVSYIVRSIDHLLKTRFNKPLGFADPSVLILDPAVGTATFLYNVIKQIHESFTKQGQTGMWNDYVAEKLLARLFGFELLMAPYAVAHLKLGLLLQETGYQFKSDQRLGIYLTNTLEEAFKKSEQLAGFNEYIVDEANAAAEIKKDKPIMVVLGNPPYSVSSVNKGEYIEKLMERYKISVRSERNIQPLSDDYIKFIRFAHDRIERTGYGIIGMITNHAYLSGLIHRGIRESLLQSFDDIWLLDLHGNIKKAEIAPDGGKDENVFDIKQGVAIILAIRKGSTDTSPKVTHVYNANLWGSRQHKYEYLANNSVQNIQWTELEPISPNYFFVQREIMAQNEYEVFPSITDIFQIYSSGLNSLHDAFVISFDRWSLISMIKDALDIKITNVDFRDKYGVADSRDWKLNEFREQIAGHDSSDFIEKIKQCLYRPFDQRWIVLDDAFVGYPRWETTHHFMSSDSLGLATTKQTLRSISCLCSRIPFGQHKIVDPYDRSYIFPLYCYGKQDKASLFAKIEMSRTSNLSPHFTKTFSYKLKLQFIEDGNGDLANTFGPEDIFNYAYAVFHSPTYRSRYAEFLKIDFPRLPLTSDKSLFKALVGKGAELVALHLMESPELNNPITNYPVSGSNMVEKVSYDGNNKRVYINKLQYFEGLPSEVWNFHIGGYQVCEKWLKDRKGRTLTYDDLTHYQTIVVALKETIRLMSEIDALIPSWPME
jgi:predicted helicase